jgi:hypothetical protein
MFTVTALPASFGDCLWIEYGNKDSPNVILIDAGPSAPKPLKTRLEALHARGGVLELVVVTHVDADHIAGMLTLLQNDFYGVPVRDFWFNGFRHLPGEVYGEKQGERLTGLILDKGVSWNVAFENGTIMVDDEAGNFPEIDLPGGAKITLLSPDAAQLAKLKKSWIEVCGEADLYADIAPVAGYFGEDEAFGLGMPDVDALADTKFTEDDTAANGSSIAFALSYRGKRILCGADAYPSRLLKSLTALHGENPFKFDAVKLPHHGSANNVSIEFVKALASPHYIFSTSGARFKHPSRPAVARVVRHGNSPNLVFNYKSEFNEIWDDALVQNNFPYTVEFGDDEGAKVVLA